MTETKYAREARWAKEAARQDAYRMLPESLAARAKRIATGKCVVDDGWCVTHDTKADLGHDLDINGTTWPDGAARND